MLKDSSYLKSEFHLSEREHSYGSNVHLLESPFHESLLARFCSEEVVQPEANALVRKLYDFLLSQSINALFPRAVFKVRTRMVAHVKEAEFEQDLLRREAKIVVVDLMRAGILPAEVCYESLHSLFPPANIRQDHISLNRKVNQKEEVVGVHMSGYKIGGPVDGSYVFVPDPMGATGSTVVSVLELYRDEIKKTYPDSQAPKKTIALHLIVTPEYLRKVKPLAADLEIFALRLDRGLSSPAVLDRPLGSKWDEERGLTDKHYIVPGAGGIGEVLNNSFV